MGCLCPAKKRATTDGLNEKLNEESETIKTEDPESQITIGLADKNDLPQKRKLAEFLLNSDINKFKKHLAEVRKLSDEDFNELFEGNTKHKFNVQNEKEFKELVQKFKENKELLSEFYNNEEYYGFISQIWRPNILYKLKDAKTFEEKEAILKQFGIKTETWDDKFKNTFNIFMSGENPINSLAERMQYYIEADYGDFDKLISTVEKCEKTVKEKDKSHCNRILDANLDTSINKLIKTLIPKFWAEKDKIISDLKAKEEENAINTIKEAFLTDEDENKLIAKVKEIYGKKTTEDKKSSLFEFGFNKEFGELRDLASKFNDENFYLFDEEYLEFKKTGIGEKAKVVFSNDMVKTAILGLSVANLTYSIMHLTKTFTQYDKFSKDFRAKFTEIKNRFDQHQKNVQIISEDVDEAIEQIIKNGKQINQDLNDVDKLIEDITNVKSEVENERNKSILNSVGSAAGIVINIFGASATEGADSVEYASGSLANICALILNIRDIKKQQDIIKELEQTLKDAKKLREDIQKEIDRLREKFNELKTKHY